MNQSDDSDAETLADILARRYVDAGWLREISADAAERNRPILEREIIAEEKRIEREKGKRKPQTTTTSPTTTTASQPPPGGLFAATTNTNAGA